MDTVQVKWSVGNITMEVSGEIDAVLMVMREAGICKAEEITNIRVKETLTVSSECTAASLGLRIGSVIKIVGVADNSEGSTNGFAIGDTLTILEDLDTSPYFGNQNGTKGYLWLHRIKFTIEQY